MKDYIPIAQFDPFDSPIGDRRWWYREAYKRHGGLEWQGPEPDLFSPHTGTEENLIKLAILEGLMEPRNHFEDLHRILIAMPQTKVNWPKKWVTCKRCKCDWTCTGYPAGKQSKFTDQINCHQLIDESGYVWFWPNICLACADYREAKPVKTIKIERKYKSPVTD
jgi:hypothetical protein